MRPKLHLPRLRAPCIPWKPLALVASLSLLTTCEPAPAEPLAGLADALRSVPGVAPRLSVATAFRACTEATPAGGTIPRARCPADRRARPGRLVELAGRAQRAEPAAAALRVLGLLDLVADDPGGRALDRSIGNLRGAAELADRPAPALADLAAALLVRAERTQAPRDLMEAYETAEQALKDDSRNLAALYNRALALDRFGLVDQTARDWAAYLAVDSTSGWADEARRRRAAALGARPVPPPAADAPLEAYARYAAADPQGARELGMDRLLAEWGEAVLAGDTARAGDRLRRAHALGAALERRPGGDASLADAVRAVRAAVDSAPATQSLAGAHREYGAGISSWETLDFVRAQRHFATAVDAGDASPLLRQWARVYLGTVRIQLGARDEGARILAGTLEADSLRYPALAARARWSLGRTQGRGESWERALGTARESARYFARAGERKNEGGVLVVLTEIHFVLGEPDSGYAAIHRALDRLRPHRASQSLHNLLAVAADVAASDGLNGASVRLLDEDVAVTARTGQAVLAAEARFRRVRHLATAGDLAGAAVDLDTARALVRQIDDEDALRWALAELREAEAAASMRSDPARATEALDQAAASFARLGVPFRVLPALVGGARARLAAGDAAGARERLGAAIRLLDQRRDSIRMEPRRAAVFDAARGVVDRIVLLTLAEGRPGDALEHMDRARASLAPAGGRTGGRELTGNALRGETAVQYARIADTLLVWTVVDGGVEVHRSVLDTARFARTVREAEAGLQRGAPEAELRPVLSRLYEWLVRPIEARLGSATPLVLVADGDVAAVPFAALYDARRGQYLVEAHSIRFAASLREARRTFAADAGEGVVLVADPAFDTREHPLLERLPHALREVRAIAPGYRGAAVLEGAAATRGAVEAALGRAGVVHFAGHAVFDDQRPERSYLVLAPGADAVQGRITAAELAELDLRGVRLVVLSACRTVRSGRNRAGGFSGLSGALLAAGAGGAVGSTWEVDDRATAALMTGFHRAYRADADGPAALRSAQLALLRSADAGLRTPTAWAGFRYAGR